MKTEIYRTVDQKLLSRWLRLWQNSEYANYINGPQWFVSVMESFPFKKYVVIATYKRGRLVAIGALVEDRRYGLDILSTVPSDFVNGFPFLVNVKNKTILQSFMGSFGKLPVIVLDNVPREYSKIIKSTRQEIGTIPYGLNFRLSLGHDLNSYFNRHRSQLVRATRGKEEKFRLRVYSGHNKKALETVFNIDDNSRKVDRGYGTFTDKNIKKFYESLATNFKENFKINILFYENTPIAYEMGFLVGSTYYGSQIAFTSKFYSYTPGKVLAVYLVESLARRKIAVVDFGSGDNHLKRAITDTYRELDKVIISKNPIVRIYLISAYKYKDKIFKYLYSNKNAYYVYRKARKIFGV